MKGVLPFWIPINKFVESDIGRHDSVIRPGTQDGEDGLNLPSVVASVVYDDLVNVSLGDAALFQLEVALETELPEVSFAFEQVTARVFGELMVALLMVVEVDKQVGQVD